MSEPVFVVSKIHSPSCYHEKALLDTIDCIYFVNVVSAL